MLKTFKNFLAEKAAQISLSLRSTREDDGFYRLIGNDYRFGTESRDFLWHAYGQNPVVFTVVDRIVQRLVQLDKFLVNAAGEQTEDPVFAELLANPNDKESGPEFLYRAAATYLVAGECFVVRRQALGEQDQYFVPINYNVIINQDVDGNVLTYQITRFGNSDTYLPNEVLHIKKPDITFDTNHGFSTLHAIRKVWESNSEVWNSEAALHKNKGITGVLYSKGGRPMEAAEREQLQKQYDTDHTGVKNFGKVKVSTAELGYIQMGMNPNDLKSIETKIEHLRTICAAYNVDSKLFGDAAASTYNNMAEAKRAMIIDAVIPLAEVLLPQIIGFMSASVLREYSMRLNEGAILELQLTQDQRSARLGREVIQGIIPASIARRELYPEIIQDIEDGETQPIPENAVSISELLAVQAAITREEVTREQAAAMLSTVYGLTPEAALEILGQ